MRDDEDDKSRIGIDGISGFNRASSVVIGSCPEMFTGWVEVDAAAVDNVDDVQPRGKYTYHHLYLFSNQLRRLHFDSSPLQGLEFENHNDRLPLEHFDKRWVRRIIFQDSDSDSEKEANSTTRFEDLPTSKATGQHQQNGTMTEQQRRDRSEALAQSQRQLPIYPGKEAIITETWNNDTIVVLGETGCGKTTQIPQYLIGPEYHQLSKNTQTNQIKVVVTQPRRVAAISLATRVSEEVGCKLGTTVGYTVRFDDCSDHKTRLKYVTDGTLLQELLSDKLLSNYDIVIIDEAHERSLRTDMLLGFLKGIQKTRRNLVEQNSNFPPTKKKGSTTTTTASARPLKVIIMSATIDAERFTCLTRTLLFIISKNSAKILYVKGRQHPVTVFYSQQPQEDYVESAVKTSLQIHAKYPLGDVLIFLTGQDEIENMQAQLQMYADDLTPTMPKMMICPLYAKLPPNQQQKVFQRTPPNHRKFILSTNVAETSITIPGVSYVIDTGFAKIKRFHSMAGVEELRAEAISQSSANQRTGRAGRECPGKCFRLYSQETYNSLAKITEPEIKRCSLSFAILHLLATGVQDIFSFDFMDKPKLDDLKFALVHLALLGALDSGSKINALGRQMATLPLDPPLARCLALGTFRYAPVNTINTRELAQEARRKFIHRDGDHLLLLNILKAYQTVTENSQSPITSKIEQKNWCKENFINPKALSNVLESRKQLRDRCKRLGLDWTQSSREGGSETIETSAAEENSAPILCSLLAGLATQLAIRQPDQSYINPITKVHVKIHPSSSLYRGRGILSTTNHFNPKRMAQTHFLGLPNKDLISSFSFNYYGTRLAVSSLDHHIYILSSDLETGKWPEDQSHLEQQTQAKTPSIQAWTAHEGPVIKVIWSDPIHGEILASAGTDGTVRIWEEDTRRLDQSNGNENQKPSKTTSKQNSALSPGGWYQQTIIADSNRTIRDIGFSPSETSLRLASISTDHHLRVYECLETNSFSSDNWNLIINIDLSVLSNQPTNLSDHLNNPHLVTIPGSNNTGIGGANSNNNTGFQQHSFTSVRGFDPTVNLNNPKNNINNSSDNFNLINPLSGIRSSSTPTHPSPFNQNTINNVSASPFLNNISNPLGPAHSQWENFGVLNPTSHLKSSSSTTLQDPNNTLNSPRQNHPSGPTSSLNASGPGTSSSTLTSSSSVSPISSLAWAPPCGRDYHLIAAGHRDDHVHHPDTSTIDHNSTQLNKNTSNNINSSSNGIGQPVAAGGGVVGYTSRWVNTAEINCIDHDSQAQSQSHLDHHHHHQSSTHHNHLSSTGIVNLG
ncbi:hypothetical protein PSHT_09842 [Puccinia striiformis]|uniref:RNA helicase n=1 Tax=Puccinia striiformis TaxID=27350 RepID=A0A2S4VE07_9BASI|nr:hypothetical protein PSHT_09842 [Puccinia striiformis]